jgi:L-fucose mutarotase
VLTTTLIHPQILSALGAAGHGSQVLIADGNYPFSTGAPGAAERVYLNLAPGLLDVTHVLSALMSAIPVEAAFGMVPDDGSPVPIHEPVAQLLGDVQLQVLPRFPFYDLARSPDTALVIATGERRVYANVLLRIGVRDPKR